MQLVLDSCPDDNSIERALIDQVRMDPALGDVEVRHPRLRCHEHALLTSAWQKAIRRGDAVLASACALALHRQDPGYVWRRIRGIALEEVSVADPQLVATVLAIAGKQRLREQLGDRALLSLLTRRLSAAPKARTACDLLVWANHHPRAAAYRKAIQQGGASLHLDRARCDWRGAAQVQLVAGLSYRGRRGWQQVAPADPVGREHWLQAIQAPPWLRYIARRGSGTDALNLLFVLVWQSHCGRGQRSDNSLPVHHRSAWIGGVPPYAWCLYSGPGREALRHFLAAREPLPEAFRELAPRDPVAGLGHLVFHVQGSCCRRVWAVPGHSAIRSAGERASLQHAGLPVGSHSELRALLADAWPALDATRRRVARLHGWEVS